MPNSVEVTSPVSPPRGNNNNNQSAFGQNNYIARPSTFSGDSTEFEWWKSKIYTYIIGLNDELWDILEDFINIQVNGVGMVYDIKPPTYAQKKI